MELSRRSRRELRRLKKDAQDLLDEQRIVLSHAAGVAQAAGKEAKRLSDLHVAPTVNEAVDAVRPTISRGLDAARRAAGNVRRATAPFVTNALVSTINKLDELENADAARQVRALGVRSGYLEPEKKKGRGGRVFAIVLGSAAAIGVGYALWQAFRTDDDLWVAPEE